MKKLPFYLFNLQNYFTLRRLAKGSKSPQLALGTSDTRFLLVLFMEPLGGLDIVVSLLAALCVCTYFLPIGRSLSVAMSSARSSSLD